MGARNIHRTGMTAGIRIRGAPAVLRACAADQRQLNQPIRWPLVYSATDLFSISIHLEFRSDALWTVRRCLTPGATFWSASAAARRPPLPPWSVRGNDRPLHFRSKQTPLRGRFRRRAWRNNRSRSDTSARSRPCRPKRPRIASAPHAYASSQRGQWRRSIAMDCARKQDRRRAAA